MKYTLTIEADSPQALIGLLTANMPEGVVFSSATTGTLGGAQITGDDDRPEGPLNPNAPAVDKNGVPWDERIHAGDKQLNGDQTWRMKRNVVKNLGQPEIDRIIAEIKARAAAGTSAPVGSPPPFNTMTSIHPGGIPPFNPGAGAPPPTFTPPPVQQEQPAPPPQQAGGMSFGDFMQRYGQAMQTGKLVEGEIKPWLTSLGLNELGQLATDPATTLKLYEWLRQNGKID